MKSHKPFRFGILSVLFVAALMTGLLPNWARAATLVVTNTADPGVGGCTASGSGDGCTLREAITAANNQTLTPGADTIDATGISGIVTLATALPRLNTNITLKGPGAASLTVQRSSLSGTPEFRIFTIDNTTTSGPTIILSGFTIANGKVSGSNAPANCGGGIYNNHGTLTVSNSIFKSNSATNGGAICNDGSLSVNATLKLINSTVTSNTATGGGGGLFNNGSGGGSTPLSISNCIFTSNRATNGGAILNDGHSGGSATITALSNSVLSANTASDNGGGISNDGHAGGSATLVISFSTLKANTATNGGGIDNNGTTGSATQAIKYSLFNANTASANGGAINNNGRTAGSATLTVGTSTFNANTAAVKGGAILNNGTGGSATVEIDNSTLKANAAAVKSAAIDWDGTGGSATLALGSVILDNGPSANLFASIINAETTFTSKNHNLSSDAAGGNGTSAPGGPYLTAGGDIRNTDPKFDPAGLQDNGGPTWTIALQADSPAIDQGLSSFPTDQRGFIRPIDNPTIANASGGDGSDIGAYERSDVSLSINDVTIAEGNTGTMNATFTITLSATSEQTVSVNAITANGTAKSPDDYTGGGASLVFAPGQTSKTFSVSVKGDLLDEDNETFFVLLSSPTNANIARGRGIGTIIDNDALPILSSGDIAVTEGTGGTKTADFTIKMNVVSGRDVQFTCYTADGTARAPSDYQSTRVNLTIPAGQTTAKFSVPLVTDSTDETDETFFAFLILPVNVRISTARVQCLLKNDDAASAPTLSIDSPLVKEGNIGLRNATFHITLSKPSGKVVSVTFSTANRPAGTGIFPATANVDYTPITTTVSVSAGQTVAIAHVVIIGDTLDEANETFQAKISNPVNGAIATGKDTGICTILDDDSAPALTINDVSVVEGNSGTKNLTFTVTLSKASGQVVTVKYTTADGIARSTSDYTAKSSTLTFAAGQTSKPMSVVVKGDTTVENDETLFVLLSGATNASIGKARGVGTILNDDASG